MPTQPHVPKTPRWQPTWRRVGATSVGAFLVVLGFLAGRMDGGADPALTDGATASRSAARQKAAATSSSTSQPTVTSYSAGGGSSADATGSSSGAPESSYGVTPDPNPPTTHSS